MKQNLADGYYHGRLSEPIAYHTVHKTSIETEDGTIKNIKVQLIERNFRSLNRQSPRRFVEFKNQFPISISGKFDPERLADINLYCENCYEIKGLSRFVKLSDLLVIDILFENDKEDYSPANKVFSLAPNNSIVELRKEKRSKILEVAAYTDFVGLNQDQPNGLIQFEAKRKIIINSTHKLWGSKSTGNRNKNQNNQTYTMEEYVQRFNVNGIKLNPTGKPGKTTSYSIVNDNADDVDEDPDKTNTTQSQSRTVTITNNRFIPVNFVWFNNVEFKLQFLKLEENNRYLESISKDVKDGVYQVRPIDLYKYQLTSFGTTLDIYRINFTQKKFSWNCLSIGVNWFNLRIKDPAIATPATDPVKTISLNNIAFQPTTSFTFRPDSRWGLTVGVAYLNHAIWNKQFDLDNTEGLLQYYVDAHHKTSENARLFFRFRLTHEVKYRYQNFTQIQLGYNVDLFNFKKNPSTAN